MMTTDLQHVFDNFAELFKERIQSDVFTTEDAVRYLFFHSVTGSIGTSPNKILLESQHPADSDKRIDMMIVRSDSRPECAFEFKFHRVSSASTPALTAQAGDIFNDIFRLANYKIVKDGSRCFFVYTTDENMKTYLGNQHGSFFNLNLDGMMDIDGEYVKRCAETMKVHSGEVTDCKVRMCLSEDFDGFAARIFEVLI